MKTNKISAPMEIIVVICDDKKGELVEEYLSSSGYNAGLLFIGKGTAESEIADLFGFGMNNRDIVAVAVPVSKTKEVITNINDITGIERDDYGLSFVMPLSSASSVLLDIAGIKI